jgi:hypothetical protein
VSRFQSSAARAVPSRLASARGVAHGRGAAGYFLKRREGGATFLRLHGGVSFAQLGDEVSLQEEWMATVNSLIGAAAGGGLMYVLDPASGARRRALARDQVDRLR